MGTCHWTGHASPHCRVGAQDAAQSAELAGSGETAVRSPLLSSPSAVVSSGSLDLIVVDSGRVDVLSILERSSS